MLEIPCNLVYNSERGGLMSLIIQNLKIAQNISILHRKKVIDAWHSEKDTELIVLSSYMNVLPRLEFVGESLSKAISERYTKGYEKIKVIQFFFISFEVVIIFFAMFFFVSKIKSEFRKVLYLFEVHHAVILFQNRLCVKLVDRFFYKVR